MLTNRPFCFSTRALASNTEGKRPRSALQPYLDHNLPTSLDLHSLSRRHNPRNLANAAEQPVSSVIHPSTLSRGDGVDLGRFVGVCREPVRRQSSEKRSGGRRSVLGGRGRGGGERDGRDSRTGTGSSRFERSSRDDCSEVGGGSREGFQPRKGGST